MSDWQEDSWLTMRDVATGTLLGTVSPASEGRRIAHSAITNERAEFTDYWAACQWLREKYPITPATWPTGFASPPLRKDTDVDNINPQPQPISRRFSYLTVLEEWKLDQACAPLWKIPGWHTYHVGSSTERRDFRDVDLRTILDDADYDDIPKGLRRLLQMSVSQLLTAQSGLPIDWQLQPMREANTDETKDKVRNAIGLRAHLADQEEEADA